jgi:hypothetical protein
VNAPRLVCLTVLLTLLSASGAYADGAYQRTEDRKKTLVWNNDPQPGDGATWSGDRDPDGYATGPGTLRWFKIERGFLTGSNVAGKKRTPISSYSGMMVHGKFNGGVMTVDHGKTYHATFADGQKKGRWSAGPLIAKAESTETATVVKKAERAAPETSTDVTSESRPTEKASEEKAQTRVAGETEDVPAAGPAEEKPEVSDQKSEVSKSEVAKEEKPTEPTKVSKPLIAQASTEEPDQSSTPRTPATKKAALQPGAVRAIERPTGTVAKKSEIETVRRAERAKPESVDKPSKIAKPASSQPPKGDIELNEDIPAEGPVAASKGENAQRPTPNAQRPIKEVSQPSTLNSQLSSKETPADNSIRTLTGPPSSLHVNAPPPETNPPAQTSTPPTAAASSPAAGPKLTSVQAMDIADIEARTKGYDLGEYQLPKAEYNAANDTWSVGYAARDAADKEAKKLSVTIQDKTGKAEVKK